MVFGEEILKQLVVGKNGKLATKKKLMKFGNSEYNGQTLFFKLGILLLGWRQGARGISYGSI